MHLNWREIFLLFLTYFVCNQIFYIDLKLLLPVLVGMLFLLSISCGYSYVSLTRRKQEKNFKTFAYVMFVKFGIFMLVSIIYYFEVIFEVFSNG